MHRTDNVIGLILSCLVVLVPAAATAQDDELADIVELVVDVHDGDGRPVLKLDAADVEVVEDGRPVEVLDTEPLAGERFLSLFRQGLPSASLRPWRIAIWFDPALATRRSQFRVADALADQAEALAALGTVEVLMAVREPEVRLGPSRDPKLVRDVLREIALASTGDEALAGLRTLFVTGGDVTSRERIVSAVDREAALVAERLGVLEAWLRATPVQPPAAIFWVADGFDADPAAFYLRGVTDPAARQALTEEIESRRPLFATDDLSRAATEAGWTVMPIALGAWPTATGADLRKLFVDPRTPLAQVALETGGGVTLDRRDFEAAVVTLGRRWRIAYEAPVPTTERRVEVRSRRSGIAVRAASRRPAVASLEAAAAAGIDAGSLPTVAGAKAVYLSPIRETPVRGRVLLRAQAVDAAVDVVVFEVDGEPRGRDKLAPYEEWVVFPKMPEPRTVAAVAYDAHGQELGRDELTVNRSLDAYRVEIRSPRSIHQVGRYDVEVTAQAPPGRRAVGVELTWDGETLARFEHPPYRHRLEVRNVAKTSVLQAVATFDDGTTAEDAVLSGRQGFSTEVEVDLVELFTVVEDRHGGLVPGLQRGDFEVREDGEVMRLEDFQYPVETPLTLGLVLDVSGSMMDDLPLLRRAAQDFLAEVLGEEDRAFLVAFASEPYLLQPATGDVERLSGIVDRLTIGGGTAIFDTTVFSLLELRAVPGRKALVLLTDGDDTTSRHSFEQAHEFARRAGIPVYVIGVGTGWVGDALRMKRLANVTGASHFAVDGVIELPGVYAQIALELRSQYLLTYEPPQRRESGWRTIEVSVRRPGLVARTVSGYYVP